ncbi:MAG TPA: DinB family protein [Acidimicrobiales bacterium]|nr:DinB family protein [Acidimicrobiales bacterium]
MQRPEVPKVVMPVERVRHRVHREICITPARLDKAEFGMQLPATDLQADERRTLDQFLDYYRAVMARKLIGLTREQANRQPFAPSTLTISGLVKHLALVEDNWFQEVVLGREMPEPWSTAPFEDDPDWDFHSATDDEPAALLGLYASACERSREAIADKTLDFVCQPTARGEQFSLRWILVHMIEETARHSGHADLLREAVDGATGD